MKSRISVVILIAFLILLSTGAAVTKSSHTGAAISTDKSDYDPDETVTISGFCFVSNARVNVEVIRPDGIFTSWTINSDGEGDFVTAYQLDGTAGMYIAKVCDGINGIESAFTITGQMTTPKGTCAATITTDKSDYNPEEVVTIKGYGFEPNVKVNVEVIRPDGTLSNWLMESDAGGFFFTTYGPDATTGMCIVKASDGVSGIEASFMIRSSDLLTN